MRHFRLSPLGVSCDETGVAIGGIAALERASGGSGSWRVRPRSELEGELGTIYGARIDLERKLAGLGVVADALNRTEIARAQVATLLMQFPDPPEIAKGVQASNIVMELFLSGLLKDEDFETKHPRTGTNPYPNRFALKPKPEAEPKPPTTARPPGWNWPSRKVNEIIRRVYKGFLKKSLERPPAEGGEARGALALADLTLAVWDALHEDAPGENFDACRNLIDTQLAAAASLPRTLDQLKVEPCDDQQGFEEHHIVERTPANLSKVSEIESRRALKFGVDLIMSSDNTVWLPRLLHEQITTKYSSKDPDDPTGRTYRQIVSEMDFYSQRQAGLQALRDFGALK